MRRAVRARGHFPTDEAATKLIWLVLHEIVGGGRNFAQIWRTKFAHSDRLAVCVDHGAAHVREGVCRLGCFLAFFSVTR